MLVSISPLYSFKCLHSTPIIIITIMVANMYSASWALNALYILIHLILKMILCDNFYIMLIL